MMSKVFAESQSLQELAPNPGVLSVSSLVNGIVQNAFVLAGLICFILLIFGGFQVIVAAGDSKKSEQGKGAITGAVIGLLVVLGSFWIIQVIKTITGQQLLGF